MSLAEHPAVKRAKALGKERKQEDHGPLDGAWLRQLVMDAGADDVGFVSIDRVELADQRHDILRAAPWARTLISYVVKMNREPIRSPARSAANLEFHHTGDQINDVGRHVVRVLEEEGIKAMNPPMGFPMEMDNFPGKIWVVSHKPVAVAAGLGKMGIHRNVIHPQFGNFILLGTLLLGREVSEVSAPIDWNPCLSCKLCVAACPVGAIGADGHFDFSACYNHNYREFMSGFTNWTEQVVESKSVKEYRQRVEDQETASFWQSLSFGSNYKAAYCLSVCPAGDDVIGPFLEDRKGFLKEIVKPLQQKVEPVYVVAGTDAEAHVAKRFPHKRIRKITSSLRPRSIQGFLNSMSLVFQREQAKELEAVYHFVFFGKETAEVTIRIKQGVLQVTPGLVGEADLLMRADSETWLGFLAKEKSLMWALVRRKIRLKGQIKLLLDFGRCFSS